jgi:hypothetical protein
MDKEKGRYRSKLIKGWTDRQIDGLTVGQKERRTGRKRQEKDREKDRRKEKHERRQRKNDVDPKDQH